MPLSEYEKGFVEAFIDTDGYIQVGRHKKPKSKRGWEVLIRLRFSNNSIQILEKLQNILGCGCIYEQQITSGGNKHYVLQITQNGCRQILPQLKLTIKEDKRKLALQILDLIRNKRIISKELYEKTLEKLVPKTKRDEKIFLT